MARMVAAAKLSGRRSWASASGVIWQGAVGIAVVVALWHGLAGVPDSPLADASPVDVLAMLVTSVANPGYWGHWMASAQRVFLGFLMGTLCGVLLGLGIGMSRAFRDMAFPVLEVLRPIPPLAWVPLSILFWPTTELSITFLTFLGSFFTILISAKAGVESIPPNYRLAALSLGADAWAIFWRIVLPASLPSIVTGMAVALGVTWEVVIAAEMIAGHAGLGYMTWDAYMADRLAGIVAGMISIGLAGFLSSAALRALGDRLMPWRKPFR